MGSQDEEEVRGELTSLVVESDQSSNACLLALLGSTGTKRKNTYKIISESTGS
jgi:hypothetical protein